MIVYVVNINIRKEVEKEWLSWMKEKHIPEIMSLKIFTKNKIFKIFYPKSENENYNSYCIKYYTNSLTDYNLYNKKYSVEIQKKHSIKYKDLFTAKRKILELINEY